MTDDVAQVVETGTRTVEIIAPYRVVHDGTAYVGGDQATVPVGVADEWIRSHWAATAVHELAAT